ncbi:MAG: hypothetical protein SGJ27_21785 [Candidatus Melainabacteria bacterium]|nr:hypothetical protein [Candidatus Melainabacteria bacterium]
MAQKLLSEKEDVLNVIELLVCVVVIETNNREGFWREGVDDLAIGNPIYFNRIVYKSLLVEG